MIKKNLLYDLTLKNYSNNKGSKDRPIKPDIKEGYIIDKHN